MDIIHASNWLAPYDRGATFLYIMIRLIELDNGSYHEESGRPSGRRREEITYAFYHVNKPNPPSGALVWVDRCTCSLPGLIMSCWNLLDRAQTGPGQHGRGW